MNVVYNTDCMEITKYKDNEFDLAFADMPQEWKVDEQKCFEFLTEFMRVAKFHIVFGYNFYGWALPVGTLIILDKGEMRKTENVDEALVMWSDWPARIRIMRLDQEFYEKSYHPAQKPYQLYAWILRHYVTDKIKILDCFVGSGNSRLAAAVEGHDYVGYELDKEYFNIQEQRYRGYVDGSAKHSDIED